MQEKYPKLNALHKFRDRTILTIISNGCSVLETITALATLTTSATGHFVFGKEVMFSQMYIHRNERSWGPDWWTVSFRAALDEAGFNETKIIIPDGGICCGKWALFSGSNKYRTAH